MTTKVGGLLILVKTRQSQVHCQLQQLKQHADGEANPDPQGATDGGDESGEAVSGRLRDGLHIERHEVDVHLEVVVLHLLWLHLVELREGEGCLFARPEGGGDKFLVLHLVTGRATVTGSLSYVVLHNDFGHTVLLAVLLHQVAVGVVHLARLEHGVGAVTLELDGLLDTTPLTHTDGVPAPTTIIIMKISIIIIIIIGL